VGVFSSLGIQTLPELKVLLSKPLTFGKQGNSMQFLRNAKPPKVFLATPMGRRNIISQ